MNNPPKVIFRMVAHNSEKTIARAMDSVLNQTYENLELHIAIRASTDSTTDIANEYASKDPRVRVIINKQAFEYDEGNDIKDYYHEYDADNDYVCFIDGDDEYKPDFLECMVPFAAENSLDIAACGFKKVCAKTGAILDDSKPESAMFIEGEMFGTEFPEYYNYLRTRWGKLYRLSLVPKLDRSRIFWQFYSDDTVETMEYYRNANRVGIYPGSFYRWYYSDESLSFKWDGRRIQSERNLFDIGRQFLADKTGHVSDRNYLYLCNVFLGSMRDTLAVLMDSQISSTEILSYLHDIFTDGHTIEAIKAFTAVFDSLKLKSVVYGAVQWITSNEEDFYNEECMSMISEILATMEILEK